MGARYYDEAIGQFISVDPLLDAGEPAQFNAYSYAFNNPVSFSDPSGLVPGKGVGTSSKKKAASASPASPPPPSTSWAAREQCKDFACTASWTINANVQVVGGVAEGIGELLWMVCSICQAGVSLGNGINEISHAASDWDGYIANKNAEAAANQAFFAAGPSAWWDAIVTPIVHDWENNPGHALGGTIVTVGTFAIPGGGILKGLTTAAKAAKAAKALRAPIGFAEGLGVSALTPGRLQHGTKNLMAAGVLPSWSVTNSPGIIGRALIPILERPTATFDHTLGSTSVRGFLGEIGGQQVAVFVYKEGPYQGQLASSSIPSANQLTMWGLK